MVKSSRTYERLGTRYLRLSIVVIVAAGLLAVGFLWWKTSVGKPGLVRSFVIAGDPAVVIMWERERPRAKAVVIPASTVIEGAFGYGPYSIAALWQLGFWDKRSEELLATSLSEALGLPVRWYIGKKELEPAAGEEVIVLLRRTFSPKSILSLVRRQVYTNIPAAELFRLWRTVLFWKPDDVTVLDLRQVPVTTPQILPDGSRIEVLDQTRFDARLGNIFYDSSLRQERISLAVFNTTQTSGLAERLARTLSHLGILVVAVGNDQPTQEGCELRGRNETLSSETAKMVKELWNCKLEVVKGDLRADLELRVGR